MGKKLKFVNGLRYTDAETAEVVQMVLAGKANKDLVKLCIEPHGRQAPSACAAWTAACMHALKSCRARSTSALSATVQVVSTSSPYCDVLDEGYIPVIATVGVDEQGQRVQHQRRYGGRARIAAALRRGKHHFDDRYRAACLRDKDDESTLIPEVNVSEVPQLIKEGIITGGMIPKMECCVEAVRRGVQKAFIIDGRIRALHSHRNAFRRRHRHHVYHKGADTR